MSRTKKHRALSSWESNCKIEEEYKKENKKGET